MHQQNLPDTKTNAVQNPVSILPANGYNKRTEYKIATKLKVAEKLQISTETLPQSMKDNLDLVRNVEVQSTENISFIHKAPKRRPPKPQKEIVVVSELTSKDRHRYKEADRRIKEKFDFDSLMTVLELDNKMNKSDVLNVARNVINTETSHRNFLVTELRKLIDFNILPKLQRLVSESGDRTSCHCHDNSNGYLKDVLKHFDEKYNKQIDSALVNALLILLRDLCYQCLRLKSMSLHHYIIKTQVLKNTSAPESVPAVMLSPDDNPTIVFLPDKATSSHAPTKGAVSESSTSTRVPSEVAVPNNSPSRTGMFFKNALSITPTTPQIAAIAAPLYPQHSHHSHTNTILHSVQPPPRPQTHIILQPIQPQANMVQPVTFQPNKRKRIDNKFLYVPNQQLPYQRNPYLTPSTLQVLEAQAPSKSESIERYADEIENGINIDDGLAALV
eukprot:TCONS_00010193-protein